MTVQAALEGAGIDPRRVFVSGPPAPGSPPPPEGPWVIVPVEAGFSVGGFGRGHFAIYETVATADEAAALVARLVEPAPTVAAPAGDVLDRVGAATAAAMKARVAARGGAAGPAYVEPGDLLDVLGPDTGHHLYALGTPLPERAQPPSLIGGEYHRYKVQAALTDAVEGVAAPWFEQPGGGAMVMTHRPIRWYVDQRMLVELA